MNRAEFIYNIKHRIKMKMAVNPTTSQLVQELCFKYGEQKWIKNGRVPSHLESPYLYIHEYGFMHIDNSSKDAHTWFLEQDLDYILVDVKCIFIYKWSAITTKYVLNQLKKCYE